MKAELHAAYAWDCEECGVENFVRAVEANLDEAAAMAAAESQIDLHYETIGDEDTTESPTLITSVVLAPARVSCKACGKSFESELYALDE